MNNLKKLLLTIFIYISCIQYSYSESFEDLSKELNAIKNEIAHLKPTPVNNPILPILNKSGKAITGMIINSSENNNIVTYIEVGKYGAKAKTGIILSKSNAKDIAAYQTARAAANLASEQVAAQASIDKALNELGKATSFMQKSFSKGDVNAAIAALAVVDVVLSDVSKNIPYDFKTQIEYEGKNLTEGEMKKISAITNNIKNKKEGDYQELKKQIETATSKGLPVEEITRKIISSGISTPKLNNYYKRAGNESLRKNLSDSIKYSGIIGKDKASVSLAVKQVAALQSGDPKKLRAFEIEKFGKAAGLSNEMINKGVAAVYSGNIQFEKEIAKSIFEKLKSNPNYNVANITNADIDKLMDEQIATEKAAYQILNSKINFGSGTSTAQVQKLANEVEKILDGKVDKSKIEQIKYNITRSSSIITNGNQVAAQLIAKINGDEYVNALNQLNIGSKSIAEQAAVVEASLNGNMEAFRQVTRSSSSQSLSSMSIDEVNQLTKIYSDVINSQNLTNQLNQEVKLAIATQEIAKNNITFNEAKKISNLAKNSFNSKKIEMNKLQDVYKALQESHKAGTSSLNDVLEVQKQMRGLSGELSSLQSSASSAKEAAIEAAEAVGEAKAAANVAKEAASGIATSEVAKEVASVTAQVQAEVKAELGTAKSFAAELKEIRETVQKEAALVGQTVDELKDELKNEIAESGIVDTIGDLQQKEREAWAEYGKHKIGDPGWAASRELYLDAHYKLGEAKTQQALGN
jgi:hypothetical protein